MKNQFKKTSLYIHTHTYSLGVKCVVENFSRQLHRYISITITALRAILLLHSPCIPRLYPSLLLHVKSALNVYLGNRTSSIVNVRTRKWRTSGRYTDIRISIHPRIGIARDKKDGWDRLERAGKRRITAIRPVQRPQAARRDAYTRACNGTPHLKFKCCASHRALRIASFSNPSSALPRPPYFFNRRAKIISPRYSARISRP